MGRFLLVSPVLLLALGTAACRGGAEPQEEGVRAPRLQPRTLERPGFRLLYPASWTVDAEGPDLDPDSAFFLEGPEGASVAFLFFDEPADPRTLVEVVVDGQGLSNARRGEFARWGRYEGYGLDVHGRTEGGVPAGMRAFAWSDARRSFLVAESYFELGYAVARPGFEAIESSFTLLGQGSPRWPDVARGRPSEAAGELEIERSGFRLRFPAGWSVDTDAPDYDPDASFTLLSPYPSSWVLFTIGEGEADADEVADAAAADFRPILSTVESETTFERWGSLSGSGRELRGKERGLDAVLRVFCHAEEGRFVVVTESWYEELAPHVVPGMKHIASSFELRGS